MLSTDDSIFAVLSTDDSIFVCYLLMIAYVVLSTDDNINSYVLSSNDGIIVVDGSIFVLSTDDSILSTNDIIFMYYLLMIAYLHVICS